MTHIVSDGIVLNVYFSVFSDVYITLISHGVPPIGASNIGGVGENKLFDQNASISRKRMVGIARGLGGLNLQFVSTDAHF